MTGTLRISTAASLRAVIAGGAVVALTAFAFLAFTIERRREAERVQAVLAGAAGDRGQSFARRIEQQVQAVGFLARWYRERRLEHRGREAADEEFAGLARTFIAENPSLFFLALATLDRDASAGGPTYQVRWVVPPDRRPLAAGTDLAQLPFLAPLLPRLVATGRPTLSRRVPCPDKDAEDGFDVWMLHPIAGTEAGLSASGDAIAPAAILIGVIDVADVMGEALAELPPADLSWRITDSSAAPGEEVLFDSVPPRSGMTRAPPWRGLVEVAAGGSWQLEARPGRGFLAVHGPRRAGVILAGGLAVSLLIGGLLFTLIGRTERIGREVRERTASLTREIVERRRAEAGLRESEERYRALAENAEDLIFVTGLDQRLRYVNRTAARLVGASPEALLEVPVGSFAPDLPGEELTRLFRHIAAGESLSREVRVPLQGRDFWFDVKFVPLRDEQGRTAAAMAIGRDTTERRRLETTLQRAKEDAEAATRAKGDFLATMSHEIRTPLNGIIGTVGLLLDGPLAGRQRELAGLARESANILLALISDVLDFSRIEAERVTIEPISFDPKHVLEDAASLYAANASTKGLELVVRCDPAVPHRVIGDAGRIRQVLLNLVSNAVKFTEHGHVVIGLALDELTGGSAGLCYSVEDTGRGIPADVRPRLFQRFEQGDASTTRRFGGSGLGLAISRRLVELMEGTIGAAARAGGGSRFSFHLTLPVDPAPPPVPPPRADLSGLRVLVVDDHEINRVVLRETLSGAGMRVTAAAGADEALVLLRAAAASRDPFRLAILDQQLPGIDGLALGRKIKGEEALRPTVLALLTSLSRRGDAHLARESGCALYLAKPVQPSRMLELLAAAWALHLEGRDGELLTRHDAAGGAAVAAPVHRPARALRVLLAEDNTINQRIACLMLEDFGCSVDVAADGREAVAMAAASSYDLVLMDCEMPELDGFAATRAIRRGETGGARHVPIVAMTARAVQGDRELCLAAGMDDYLCKPVTAIQLAAAVERHAPQQAPAPAPPPGPPTAAGGDPPRALDPGTAAALRKLCRTRERWEPLVELFESCSAELVAALHDAAGAGNALVLQRTAHKLKGSCANFGAPALQALSLRLEELGAAGTLAAAAELLPELERAWADVRAALALERARPWEDAVCGS